MAARDRISVRNMAVDCVVGLYPSERHTPQPLHVDLELTFDSEPAAVHEDLGRTVDYKAITAQVTFLLESCRFELLETAAHALANYLLAPPVPGERRAAIESVVVTLTKPGALAGRAFPSLRIERNRDWAKFTHEEKPFGTVDIIHETRAAGIYRLNVAPGRGIPLHRHEVMREAEMVLTAGLLCQGQAIAPGTVHRWPQGASHRYDNPTDKVQTILCVDSPRFMESDEIQMAGEPAEVTSDLQWVWHV